MYPDTSLFIDGAWGPAASGKTIPVLNPATGEPVGKVAHAETRRSRPRACRRQEGLPRLEQDLGLRPLQDHAQGRRHPARARRRDRPDHDDGTGQAGRRGERRDDARRPTSSTGSPRRRAAPMAAPFRRAPTASCSSCSRSRSARSRRSRRGTSRSTRRCARFRSRSPPAARSSSRARRRRRPPAPQLVKAFADAGVPAGRDQSRLRRAVGDLRVPDPASGDPQDLVHRLDRGRQASRRARRPAHEAHHDGAWRPCAGDRVRRRRRRRRGEDSLGQQVPQCRPGLRRADALPGAGEASTTPSSRSSPRQPRR